MSHPVNKLFLALVLSVVAVPQGDPGKEPLGIVPLRSSRVEVEKIVGKPKNAGLDKHSYIYELSDKTVSVTYAMEKCDFGWNVPQETVVRFSIFPKVMPELTALGLDLTKIEKVQGDYDVLDHFYYILKDRGLRLSVRSGMVQEYIYEPTPADDHLRCTEDREKPAMPTDCLPLAFAIDCSSELIQPGSPVECKVKFAATAKDFHPILEWNASRGVSLCGENPVKIYVVDSTVKDVSLTVKVVSPKLCFNSASTTLRMSSSRNIHDTSPMTRRRRSQL